MQRNIVFTEHGLIIIHQTDQFTFMGRCTGNPHLSADFIIFLIQIHLMAGLDSRDCRLKPGQPGANNHNMLRSVTFFYIPLTFIPGPGICHTRHRLPGHYIIHASLKACHTGTDFIGFAGHSLIDPVWISNQPAANTYHIRITVFEQLFRLLRRGDPVGSHHRNRHFFFDIVC